MGNGINKSFLLAINNKVNDIVADIGEIQTFLRLALEEADNEEVETNEQG